MFFFLNKGRTESDKMWSRTESGTSVVAGASRNFFGMSGASSRRTPSGRKMIKIPNGINQSDFLQWTQDLRN